MLATKAAVIAADSVASALVREARPFDWIDSTIHRPSLTADEIEEDILRPRADQLSRARGKTFRFHRFQELSAEQGPRALLLAACGAGKTLAAWRWAAAQARTRPFGRVVFMYPTRGTATEGFRDYVGWAPEGDAALVHGTARYELETMLSNPPESLAGKDPRIADEDARLFALAFWSPRYFSATVDQFLGFLEHQYASMCLLPVLADSAVVIDEVHSFDRRMFDDLVAFLTAFDVPVLCMTATLGASRRAELERRGLDVFPREEHRAELADLDEQERHSRYRIEMSAPEFPALLDRVVCAAWEGLRVLWVVNTVARCQRAAVAVQMALGRTPLVYHSRFRLRDRRVKHESVVSAFQRTEATVAITTQVCEMSLDLDADLLLTEVAPVSSLVQRFGRANRHRARGDAFLATLIVYPPESAIPYATDDIRRGTEFSTAMVGVTSQRALADALERWATPEPAAEGSARFLESGYFATPGPFRDTDEYAGPCVLDADLPELQERLRVRRPWDDLVINVPQRAHLPERPDWLPRHLRVAPNRAYDIHLGFVVS